MSVRGLAPSCSEGDLNYRVGSNKALKETVLSGYGHD